MFRELFVEVAEALLEGAAERASRHVSLTVPPLLVQTHFAWTYTIEECAKHVSATWRPELAERREGDNVTILRVRLACGHRGWFRLEERVLVTEGPSEIVDYIYDVIDGEPSRKCTCVEYVPPPPCTAGACR